MGEQTRILWQPVYLCQCWLIPIRSLGRHIATDLAFDVTHQECQEHEKGQLHLMTAVVVWPNPYFKLPAVHFRGSAQLSMFFYLQQRPHKATSSHEV